MEGIFNEEINSVDRTKMALLAVLVLCVSSAASAGYPVGPMGQLFEGVNPVDHPNLFGGAEKAYGYVIPHARPHRTVNYR